MTCSTCKDAIEVNDQDAIFAVRACPDCGRKYNVRELGDHGIGVKFQEGDQIVVPPGAIKISANPLKGNGKLTKAGVAWFAEIVFETDLAVPQADFRTALEGLIQWYVSKLKTSERFAGVNFEDQEQVKRAYAVASEDKSSLEWWLFQSASFLWLALHSIDTGNAAQAAWAMANAERLKALCVFKEHFEEAVWMAQSAKSLIDLFNLWTANKNNADEEFWQIQFGQHSVALSQLFSVPVTMIQDKAYVGGQGINRSDARIVDFLFSGGSASEAILVEIKTPVSKLMQVKPYRGNAFSPSSELSGSVVQALDYRNVLLQDLKSIAKDKFKELKAFNPKTVIVIGNSEQLKDDRMRRSFELFRAHLADIEIVTFDEVFRKIEQLSKLFGLVQKG